ncbi:MAG TPA: response regulator transcription factor [Devosia sp.]|nr:response regulator transcription factor [Devosia sp.]
MDRRIIIVDDHPLFRAALGNIVSQIGPGYAVRELDGLGALSAALKADRDWDLVLLDLNIPGAEGLSGLLLLRAEFPELPVMIVSAVADPLVIRQAVELGASGYLAKSADPAEIRAALDAVLAGDIYVPEGISLEGAYPDAPLLRRLASLTPQQVRVLMMLAEGLMNKQIAHQLSISEATVKAHVSTILQKLDVDSRTQAVIVASRIGRDVARALAP